MRVIVAAFAAMLLGAGAAQAEGSAPLPPIANAATLKECGACHMAFQPQMLPMRSWKAIMAHLASHFGEDASLPDATRSKIEAYLVAHAGDAPGITSCRRYVHGIPASAVPLRITDTRFWHGAHGEISAAEFTSTKVKSKANCVACHRGAQQGRYGEEE